MSQTTTPADTTTRGLVAAAYVFAVVMMGTTLPTPLYPDLESEYGFAASTTTLLFAVYAAGVIATLVVAGRLSDAVGRKPLLVAGIVASLISAVLFATGGALWVLFVARIFSGLSAGVLTSTGTVVVLESAPDRFRRIAAPLATAANIGGLGLGMFVGGLVAQLTSWPTRAPFVLHALLLVVAALALLALPETSARQGPLRIRRPTVPPAARPAFAAASWGAVAGFAVCGFFSSEAPDFMGRQLHVDAPLLVGVVAASLFGASAVAQILLRGLPPERAVALGAGLLLGGMVLLAVALPTVSLAFLLAAAIVSGAGQGLLFSFGLRAITAASPAGERTEATSAYFIVAYLSISLPTIAAGLIQRVVGSTPTGIGFALVVAALCVRAFATRRRFAS